MYEVIRSNEWQLGVSLEGIDYVFCWQKTYIVEMDYTEFNARAEYKDESEGHVLYNDDKARYSDVIAAGSAFRVNQLQKEFPYSFSTDTIKAQILNLFERSEADEFLGQDGAWFTPPLVAKILKLHNEQLYEALNELHADKLIGFNGMILVPYEEEAAAAALWEERTGHKDLVVTDSGNWSCSFCGKYGFNEENEPSAKDVPCIKA